MSMSQNRSSSRSAGLALLFLCVAMPALAHGLSALWPAARYAGGFMGEPMVDDYEKREAFPALVLGQKRSLLAPADWIPLEQQAGPKERRAPFSAEEDRWMKAMDNLRKPRFG